MKVKTNLSFGWILWGCCGWYRERSRSAPDISGVRAKFAKQGAARTDQVDHMVHAHWSSQCGYNCHTVTNWAHGSPHLQITAFKETHSSKQLKLWIWEDLGDWSEWQGQGRGVWSPKCSNINHSLILNSLCPGLKSKQLSGQTLLLNGFPNLHCLFILLTVTTPWTLCNTLYT